VRTKNKRLKIIGALLDPLLRRGPRKNYNTLSGLLVE
jgi:hypothetical protein